MSENDKRSRKGTPIESPQTRRNKKLNSSGSSHNLLSPINTLDGKREGGERWIPQIPPKKYENPLPRTYSIDFPIKTEKLPSAFTSSSYSTFKTIIDKYPSDTFCTEKEALSTVTKNHVNVLSDSEDEKIPVAFDSKVEFDVKSYYKEPEIKKSAESFFDSYIPDSSPKKTSKTSVNLDVPLTTFTKPRVFPTLLVSNVEYRNIMLPQSRFYDDQNLKLIFVSDTRIVSLVNRNNNDITIPFAKIARVQFIRNENLPSNEWYIDFVLNCMSLNFEPFGITPSNSSAAANITFEEFNTLRVNLGKNCGLSAESIEGLLISILRDRNAFYFTAIRDPYGEFEKSNNSTNALSPKRYTTPVKRIVPSLESLSSSESVKSASSVIKRNSNSYFQTNIYSPGFTVRRTSKRLAHSPPKDSPKYDSSEDAVYIDPTFESERVILFTFPEGELDSVYVTSHELERLEPKIWLNDTNIDFELKFLLSQLDPKLQDKIHVFSSFFYRRLSSAKLSLTPSNDGTKTGFDLIKSWTRKVNLFEKDFLIVPICENLHWFLSIICYPSKMLAELIEDKNEDLNTEKEATCNDSKTIDENVDIKLSQESQESKEPHPFPIVDLDPEPVETTKIFIFDSLGMASRGKGVAVINRLRTYLQLEALDKLKRDSSKSACTGHVVKVPQQENYTDCGCFLLQFAEEFIRAIPKDIVNKIQEQNNDMSDWFPSSLAQSRREIMKKRVKELAADFAQREKLKNDSKPADKHEQQEDRSSDIEEIVMLPSK